MTTFKELAEAWIASREHCSGSLGRIRFWVDEFGPLQVDQISEDQVDQAIRSLGSQRKAQRWYRQGPRPTYRGNHSLAPQSIDSYRPLLASSNMRDDFVCYPALTCHRLVALRRLQSL